MFIPFRLSGRPLRVLLPFGRALSAGVLVLSAGGCGLEACGSLGDFKPTPEAEAVITGTLEGVPVSLRGRLQEAPLIARAISVDGAELASTSATLDEPFQLALGEGLDHFNVRVVLTSGSFVAKEFVAEAPAGSEADVTLSVTSTAAAQIVERYGVRERASLASTPPQTLREVRDNARGDDERVAAYRAMVESLMGAMSATGDEGLETTSFGASDALLQAAGVDAAAYDAALEAAVDASVVPIVCDPSQVNVLFTVDASGQGKDGNGAPQVLRQPIKEGKVFLGITLDPTSPVPDSGGVLRPRLTPNDPATEMFDDGTGGDEVAGDGIFSRVVGLPRGMRVLYKYTNGSPNEGFTGTEEWPGNARILQVNDVLTSSSSGQPDCLVIRRDSFGDEASNKNFVNLHARLGGGDLGYTDDLGGPAIAPAPEGEGLLPVGGLTLEELRTTAPLTPAGIAEARENGVCTVCPAPLTVSADDDSPPRVVAASFLAVDQTRVIFSEDVDVQSAGLASNYLLVDENNAAVRVLAAAVTGSQVTLRHDRVDPRKTHRVSIKEVKDASLQQNPLDGLVSVNVGPDRTPPTLVDVRGGSIVEVNPLARPSDPATGEVFILTFSEELDRIAAENAANYIVEDGSLEIFAAFQRGREVLLVTSQHERGRRYPLSVGGVFDVAGNVAIDVNVEAAALSLHVVTFKAVVDFAWTSIDGTTRGLPAGDDLYLTGTVMRDARGVDGEDLRVSGRTDVAGIPGFVFAPTDEIVDGGRVYSLSVRLPAGSYAYKFAHGNARDAVDPPASLESVSKGLATRNDLGGVRVHPGTLVGNDGVNYAGARLSTNGADLPGPGVLFKRENPDNILIVGEADRDLAPEIIGTWRDVPFGSGADYDDGLVELPLAVAGDEDTGAPRLLAARARDSESVLLSFDEAVIVSGTVNVAIAADQAALPIVETVVGQPLSTQVVVRTGAMVNDTAYALVISGLADTRGNSLAGPVTAGFTSPAFFQAFQPLIDDVPPAISTVRATSPTQLEVVFTERLAEASVAATDFVLTGTNAPEITAARLQGGGTRVLLTTTAQERQASYSLTVQNVDDIAGNTLTTATVSVLGFGEFDPPEIARVFPLSSTSVALLWNEPVLAQSATRLTSYLVTEVQVTAVRFSAADELRNAAFNATFAPLRQDVVILTTTPMTAGGTYTVTAEGVTDLSGNESAASATFTAVGTAPTVNVLLTYTISDNIGVVGVGAGGAAAPPARAISASTLSAQREGVFALGTALSQNGVDELASHPFTTALTGFPADGAALTGVEPELRDDGQNGDAVAGDSVYTLRIANVPVGSTLSWKAFASFTTAFAAQNPSFPGAAFADAPRGPSVFGDGQEYPGNDNAVFIIGDDDGDGTVRIDCLFGDEITFKRKTGFPAFHVAVGDAGRAR